MFYRQLRKGVADKSYKLVPITENILDYIDSEHDYYVSIYEYSEEQKKQFDSTGSIAGIRNNVTHRLIWDFDSKEDLEKAKDDTVLLCSRLEEAGVNSENLIISFSGQKGFGVEVEIDAALTPEQFKDITFKLADGLETHDKVVNDSARIIRVLGTKHQKTGLYKIPLTVDELIDLSIEQIKAKAKSLDNVSQEFSWSTQSLPRKLLSISTPVAKIEKETVELEIDFDNKTKGWTNCKWSLLNGNFQQGNRHYPILAIIATCRSLCFPKETAYYIAKSASKKSALIHGEEEHDKTEIWKKVEEVYSPRWEGGSFSCRDGKSPWLTDICNNLGVHKCQKEEDEKVFLEMNQLSSIFGKFATEIEKNKIKTGVPAIDDKVTLCTSMLVGLLANPGTGKTSFALNILNHTNKHDVNSIFFSMDMGVPLVYLRMIQKHFCIPMEEAFDLYKNDPIKAKEFDDVIAQEYPNVKFSFKSGLNVENIKNAILNHEKDSGQKVKLVVVDYLECIAGPYSDATANTAIIANQLKDVANETETCILLLLQTQKHSAAPDEPLLSMKNIKGSSVIEQACSVVLTMWREGYNPKYSKQDNYVSFATVKNRLNTLWSEDFHWTGLTGHIRELTSEEHMELKELRDMKKMDKASNSKDDWG